jgi:hypothetical protein
MHAVFHAGLKFNSDNDRAAGADSMLLPSSDLGRQAMIVTLSVINATR